ncbi:SDR family oxidoreductase [Iodidimonas sp. SYSU 1G8]|uniref:SDR family NAD(P)-dependent oxidoreductase n=1 Tax=Iodidimonas sp. SYSU 1G8 TaxID=3133967 RepID=UPI0031FE6498
MISLEGTVALVTGAAGGIGRATCAALIEAGAVVIATGTNGTAAARKPPGTEWLDLDVTDEAAWAAAAADIEHRHGRLDILVNNAGVSIVERFEDVTYASWRRTMAINTDGVFLGIRAMLPLLRAAGPRREGGASVISVSSVAGIVGAEFNAAYCASKGAVRLLTKSLALEFSAFGYPVRVNSIHPGGVDTDMVESIFQSYADVGAAETAKIAYDAAVRSHPRGRMAKPEEIAAGIRFMASDEASNMHGSEMILDGGFTAR